MLYSTLLCSSSVYHDNLQISYILGLITITSDTCVLFGSRIQVMFIVVHRSTSAMLTDSGAGSRTSRRLQSPKETPLALKSAPIPTNEADNGESI